MDFKLFLFIFFLLAIPFVSADFTEDFESCDSSKWSTIANNGQTISYGFPYTGSCGRSIYDGTAGSLQVYRGNLHFGENFNGSFNFTYYYYPKDYVDVLDSESILLGNATGTNLPTWGADPYPYTGRTLSLYINYNHNGSIGYADTKANNVYNTFASFTQNQWNKMQVIRNSTHLTLISNGDANHTMILTNTTEGMINMLYTGNSESGVGYNMTYDDISITGSTVPVTPVTEENITFSVSSGSNHIIGYQTTNSHKWGQTFVGNDLYFKGYGGFYYKGGSPTDKINISIFETSAGVPTGNALAFTLFDSTLVTDTSTPPNDEIQSINESNLFLNSSKTYMIVFSRTGSLSTTNYVVTGSNNVGAYGSGKFNVFQSGSWDTTTWSAYDVYGYIMTYNLSEVSSIKGINVSASYLGNPLSGFNSSIYYSNGTLINTNNTLTTSTFHALVNNGSYIVSLQKSGYAIPENYSFSFTNTSLNYDFKLQLGGFLNLSFYNETSNQLLNNVNVSYQVIIGDVGINGSTSNGTSEIINVSSGIVEIIYGSEDFFQRKYFAEVFDYNFSKIKLYLLSEGEENVGQLDFTVIDDNFGGVSNATIKLLRRYTENGAVITRIVEMSKSDINGQGYLHLQKLTGDYQFVIEYLGNTVLTTGINTIKDSTTTLRIELRENVIDSVVYNNVITKNISYDSTNREFVLYYNDPNNVVNQICFIVDRVVGSGFVNVNSTCTSLSTGTIILGIGPQNGTYTAYAYIDTNTQFSEHPFLTYSITINSFTKNALGIFLIVGLVVSIALAGMFLSNGNPTIVLSLFGAGIFIGSFFLGLAVFTYTTVILLLFGIAWIIFMIRRRGE